VSAITNVGALAAGIFGLFVLIRMLWIAGASADGEGFRRAEQPILYWGIFAAGVLVDGALFYFALAG
jgi:hypothetical protein